MGDEATHEDVLSRLAGLEERIADDLSELTKQTKAQGAFLFGGPRGPGLAELVRAHEAWITIQRKILMVLFPAILLGVGAVVWQAVTSHLGTG